MGAEARFCDRCGAALENAAGAGTPATDPATRSEPSAELRLVTVLFADLVGFTGASEGRDAEETRELLSRYFDLARTRIARFGGTVEKFIGDAVMAVWGAPTATEDDAERAVRAALDLVGSVPELDPKLRARAGVLTGEAAVTLGAQGEGMVAGDLVNTASRIQSVAEPGTVVVGEGTRRATEEAIAYESLGTHELKGKTEPVPVWRALRLISGRGGSLRSAGLEPPFVGRDRELRLIKDLFHACAAEHKAQLVSVTGIAGIGKSRLIWEFYKYIDGMVDDTWWHRGRCLAYGEGVAYWALADMIRMRCRIAEDEEPASARAKLASTLSEHVPDSEERRFVEPRLAQLLGLEEGGTGDRQDMFAAWRLFFERLAQKSPALLVFEDLQWADAGLLDFIEYLLEWSRELPLYVVTLARPELHERRSAWGAGQRNFTSLYLEPFSEQAMRQLLEGLVPGLPDEVGTRIRDRAQGVPLYAVETIRMLLDRGLLVPDGSVYRLQGEVQTLDVPETLHALIAARLDGLTPEERRLLQQAAVLGKTFTRHAVAALAGQSETDVEPLLNALVRKEVLSIQADPRSPERGQYGFLQDLVRHVAYETLAKRDRKSRHLAAAAYLEATMAEEEIAEVLASHYIAAYEAAPDADDAPAIRDRVREMLARAGERASLLGAPEEGRRYFVQAAELSDEPRVRSELLLRGGRLAAQANRIAEARQLIERAVALETEAEDQRGAARASVALADIDLADSRVPEAIERLQQALPTMEAEGPNADLADLLAQLGRLHVLGGQIEQATPYLERALRLSERLQLTELFLEALISKGIMFIRQGRLTEARILLEAAIERSGAEQLFRTQLRATNNLAVVLENSDQPAEAMAAGNRVIALARLRGDSRWESQVRAGTIIDYFYVGRWDDALKIAAEEEPRAATENARIGVLDTVLVQCERGELEAARVQLDAAAMMRPSEIAQTAVSFAALGARLLRAEGRLKEALAEADRGFRVSGIDLTDDRMKRVRIESIEAALAMNDLTEAERLLAAIEELDPGQLTPFLEANWNRLSARLLIARGDVGAVEERFKRAAAVFRECSYRFYLAVTLLEHAEWLTGRDRLNERGLLLAEAEAIFGEVRAEPWLERLRQVAAIPLAYASA